MIEIWEPVHRLNEEFVEAVFEGTGGGHEPYKHAVLMRVPEPLVSQAIAADIAPFLDGLPNDEGAFFGEWEAVWPIDLETLDQAVSARLTQYATAVARRARAGDGSIVFYLIDDATGMSLGAVVLRKADSHSALFAVTRPVRGHMAIMASAELAWGEKVQRIAQLYQLQNNMLVSFLEGFLKERALIAQQQNRLRARGNLSTAAPPGRPSLRVTDPEEWWDRMCKAQESFDIQESNPGMALNRIAKRIKWGPGSDESALALLRRARKAVQQADEATLQEITRRRNKPNETN